MSTAENYLRDALTDLLAKAKDAAVDSKSKRSALGDDAAGFETGRALAYYEVVSYLLSQMDVFQMEREKYGVPPGFDPEKELI